MGFYGDEEGVLYLKKKYGEGSVHQRLLSITDSVDTQWFVDQQLLHWFECALVLVVF